jgi:hypothetical protein
MALTKIQNGDRGITVRTEINKAFDIIEENTLNIGSATQSLTSDIEALETTLATQSGEIDTLQADVQTAFTQSLSAFNTATQADQKVDQLQIDFNNFRISTEGENFIVLKDTGDETTNGQNLIQAYTDAKTKTPNQSNLSSTNRYKIILDTAVYKIDTDLVLDTDYIDLVGEQVSEGESVVKYDGNLQGDGSHSGEKIEITAVDAQLENLTIENIDAFSEIVLFTNLNQNNLIIDNVNFIGQNANIKIHNPQGAFNNFTIRNIRFGLPGSFDTFHICSDDDFSGVCDNVKPVSGSIEIAKSGGNGKIKDSEVNRVGSTGQFSGQMIDCITFNSFIVSTTSTALIKDCKITSSKMGDDVGVGNGPHSGTFEGCIINSLASAPAYFKGNLQSVFFENVSNFPVFKTGVNVQNTTAVDISGNVENYNMTL